MISPSSIFVFIALIAPLLFFFFFFNRSKKNGRKLPGPPKLPLIGNLHQLASPPHKNLLTLSRKYGDLMFLQLGSVPAVVISSAKMAEEIFRNHDLAFSNRPSLYILKRFTNNVNISLAPYGEYWREVRKIAVLELLMAKRVESFESIREEEVARMVDEIEQESKSCSSPCIINLSSLVFRLSNVVICRAAFGRRNDPQLDEIMHRVQSLVAFFNIADYFPWLSVINKVNGIDKEIDHCIRELDALFEKIIVDHRSKLKPEKEDEDIIDVLLRLQKDSSNRSIELTMDHIKGIFLDLFFAGTDTSSATTEWTMAELMRNPETREKLQREVREIGAGKQGIEEMDLPKLPYLKLVIRESLRLHPPAPLLLPRETTETVTICDDLVIPEKTRVIVNATALSLDAEYWEKPEMFWPERFSDNKIDYRGQHFGYLPFGTGRRSCPGINFAVQLVELVVANLIFRYDWELPPGMRAEDMDMEEELGLVMHKKVPLRLVAKPVRV